jgi:hypothetical protein
MNKMYGFGALVALLIFSLVLAFGGFAHVNGFGNFGSERFLALEKADKGLAGYWTAMIVIESIGWIAATVIGAYGGYIAFTRVD